MFFIAIASFSFTNAQQKIEKQEVQNEKAIKSFKTFDADFNEAISLKEFKAVKMKDKAYNESVTKESFSEMDTDKNGSISMKEYTVAFEMKKKSVKKRELRRLKKTLMQH
ncbi:EF-hand domain-containing protein [Winogradskyella eckloniae]|uniref:EF-hand domain-containing protein n=1 Tax=Winogradskyella eckloniae TaxID=1089306 RepID=UPI00156547E3|nr:EF-hand domain-containing protein [Winogradskyella eckloniae]